MLGESAQEILTVAKISGAWYDTSVMETADFPSAAGDLRNNEMQRRNISSAAKPLVKYGLPLVLSFRRLQYGDEKPGGKVNENRRFAGILS